MSNFYLNEDNSNFFGSFPATEMTVPGLRKFILGYARKQVGAVVMSVNAQRASYRSSVIDAIWDGIEYDAQGRMFFHGREFESQWAKNAKLLDDSGINPYCVWIDALREAGKEAWVSCRMNDLHNVDDEDNYMHDRLWRAHPEYRRSPYDGTVFGQAFDFAHEEVRKNKIAFLAEVLEKFDADGLELDWTRFPAFLKPGCELRDAHFITEIMREARRMAREWEQKRGRKIKIGVRVMSSIEDNMRFGLDVINWVKEDLVDVMNIGNFWPTINHDIPFEIWRAVFGKSVELNACLEYCAAPTHGIPHVKSLTKEMISGASTEYLYRGADHIYLFNQMNGNTGMGNLQNELLVLDNCGDYSTASAMSRRHVVTYTTIRPQGIKEGYSLPRVLDVNCQSFRINVGGMTDNRSGFAVIGLEQAMAAGVEAEVYVNGEKCALAEAPQLTYPIEIGGVICVAIPSTILHDGDNVVDVCLKGGEAKAVWFEIYIP